MYIYTYIYNNPLFFPFALSFFPRRASPCWNCRATLEKFIAYLAGPCPQDTQALIVLGHDDNNNNNSNKVWLKKGQMTWLLSMAKLKIFAKCPAKWFLHKFCSAFSNRTRSMEPLNELTRMYAHKHTHIHTRKGIRTAHRHAHSTRTDTNSLDHRAVNELVAWGELCLDFSRENSKK